MHFSTLLTISPLMSASHLFMAAPSNMCYMRIQSPRDFIFQAGIWYCETTTMDLLVVVHYPVRNSKGSLDLTFLVVEFILVESFRCHLVINTIMLS